MPRTGESAARGLRGTEWVPIAAMIGVIAALHVVGWLTLVEFVAPRRPGAGGPALGIGIGVTAYTLGLRHAFDADHIAAIDNTTRKLMNDRQRPVSVGFFFSLGHSTVVFVLALALALGVTAIVGPIRDQSSGFHHYTGLIGTSVSGMFLYLIAVINVVIVIGIVRAFRSPRDDGDEADLQTRLVGGGPMNRVFGRLTRSVTAARQMYPIGVLFGLGFDTATEVALLILAATSVADGLPWYAILCLPVLFAAGMSLLDTIDGSFMNFAYGWAFAQPVRKAFYNLTITVLSATVALIVGTVELLGVLVGELNWHGEYADFVRGINLNVLGYVIVGLFVLTWAAAVLIWHYGRFAQQWSDRPSGPTPRRLFGSPAGLGAPEAQSAASVSARQRVQIEAAGTQFGLGLAREFSAGQGSHVGVNVHAQRPDGRRFLSPPERAQPKLEPHDERENGAPDRGKPGRVQ